MPKIISGKFRGRNIETVAGKEVRPTTSMTREAVFNILMHGNFGEHHPLVGQHVVDLFCGTGALGFEALSRGASHVTFVDQNQKALEMVARTVEKMDAGQETRLLHSDSTQAPMAMAPCRLAFVDPPYGKKLAAKGLKSLIRGSWLEQGAVVVVEQSKHDLIEIPEEFELHSERTYGISRILILQYKANG